MEQPTNEWKPYLPICLENLYTDTIYKNKYSIYIVSRDKRKYWEIITEIYQYMRKLYGKNHPRYERRLYTILYHAEPPYNLNAKFATEEINVWSNDPAVQEHSKQLFKNWKQLEEYYNDLLAYCRWKPERDRQLAEAAAEQARIKEERRIKRLSNDPDNPAARKRKARRHLQRLGYDLHIARKHAYNKGFQIVKLNTGEIVAGADYDLSLYDVERFYMDADLEREKNYRWDECPCGHLYNFEPELERRERVVREKLEKKHYRLTRTCQKVLYKDDPYIIEKRKRIRKQDKFEKVFIDGRGKFTLDEVETFVAENC